MIHSLFAEQVAPRNRVWTYEDLLIDKYNVDQRPAGKQTEKQSDCTLAGLKLALAHRCLVQSPHGQRPSL